MSPVPRNDPRWKVDDFSLEMGLGCPELLSGLDTSPQLSLHTGGMGSPGSPEGSQLPPKEDLGNTEPSLLLEGHPAHGRAGDLGETEDSDFVMVP